MLLFRFTILNLLVLLVFTNFGTNIQITEDNYSEIEKFSHNLHVELKLNLDLFPCKRHISVRTLYCHSNKELNFDPTGKESSYDTCLWGKKNTSLTYEYFVFICKTESPKIKFAIRNDYVYTSTTQLIGNGLQSIEFTKERIQTISDKIRLHNIPNYYPCNRGNQPTKQLYCNSNGDLTFIRDHTINSYKNCLHNKFKAINSDSYNYNDALLSLRCNGKTQKIIINLKKYLCFYKIPNPRNKPLDQTEEDEMKFICDYQKDRFGLVEYLPNFLILPIFSEKGEEVKLMCFDGYYLEDLKKYKIKYNETESPQWKISKTEEGTETRLPKSCKVGCEFQDKFDLLGINMYFDDETKHTILVCVEERLNTDVPEINPECRTTREGEYNWYWNGEIFNSFEDMGCSPIPNPSYTIPNSESGASQKEDTDTRNDDAESDISWNGKFFGTKTKNETDEDKDVNTSVLRSESNPSDTIPSSKLSASQKKRAKKIIQRVQKRILRRFSRKILKHSKKRKYVNQKPSIYEESKAEGESMLLSQKSSEKTSTAGIRNHPYYKWIIISILLILCN